MSAPSRVGPPLSASSALGSTAGWKRGAGRLGARAERWIRSLIPSLTWLCLSALASIPVQTQPPRPPVSRLEINVGFTRSTLPELNQKDLEASFKALSSAIGRRRGYEVSMKTHVYERSSDFDKAIHRGEVQVAFMGAWEYLDMKPGSVMEPMFLPMLEQQLMTQYLLLTHRQSGLNTLRDLRGKDVLLLTRSQSLLSMPWLEVLLGEAHLGPEESFFRSVEQVQKPAGAVLPVFFGKRQACVVDRNAFRLMAEMNPQVGRDLQVVATSAPFLSVISSISRQGWLSEQHRIDFCTALRELHQDAEGRHLLMLFKVDRLVPFQEGLLASLIDLRTRHRSLIGRPPP
jgi:phosphonate transport system substrate-binding protein